MLVEIILGLSLMKVFLSEKDMFLRLLFQVMHTKKRNLLKGTQSHLTLETEKQLSQQKRSNLSNNLKKNLTKKLKTHLALILHRNFLMFKQNNFKELGTLTK